MRNYQFAIITIIAMVFAAFTVQAQTFEVRYNVDDFSVVKKNDSVFTVKTAVKHFYSSDKSAPQLPYLSANILCAQGTVECDPVITYTKEPIATGILLETVPEAVPTSMMDSYVYTPTISTSSQLTPYRYDGVGKMRGFSFAQISLSPFVYEYDTKTLYFIKKFVITLNEKVQTKSAAKSETASTRLGSPSDIADLVLNSADIEAMYPSCTNTKRKIVPSDGGEDSTIGNGDAATTMSKVDYLIITSNRLQKAFTPLIEWKELTGTRVAIETVENILANPEYDSYDDSNNAQLKIKRCINSYYMNHNVDFVLLGGNEEQVPTQDIRLRYEEQAIYMPDVDMGSCDWFYACFDGAFDWNANKDDFVCDTADNVDFYPEVYIGRIPINTFEQAVNYIEKLIDYELFPQNKQEMPCLFTGSLLHDKYFYNMEPYSDSHYWSNKVYNYARNLGLGTADFFFDTGINNPLYGTYSVMTPENLQYAFSRNYGLIHIAMNGTQISFITNSKSFPIDEYTTNEAEQIANVQPSIFISTGSMINGFHMCEPSLCEVLLRNPVGGAIAMYGACANSLYYYHEEDVCGVFSMTQSFIEGMLSLRQLGRAAVYSKIKHLGSPNTYNLDRWNQLTMQLLGDPQMEYYPSLKSAVKPEITGKNFNDIVVSMKSNSPAESLILLLSDNDNGDSYLETAHLNQNESYRFSPNIINKNVCDLKLLVYNKGYKTYSTILKKYEISGVKNIESCINGYYVENLPSGFSVTWSLDGDRITMSDSELETDINVNSGFVIKVDKDNLNHCWICNELPEISFKERYLMATIYDNNMEICGYANLKIFSYNSFEAEFIQVSSIEYPGISKTIITNNYRGWIDEEICDSAIIAMSSKHELSVNQNINYIKYGEPIYVYPKCTVFLRSNVFKYMVGSVATPSLNFPGTIDFSKMKSDGLITFSIDDDGDELPLQFHLNGFFSDAFLNFIATHTLEPTIIVLDATYNYLSFSINIPINKRKGIWEFKIMDLYTGLVLFEDSCEWQNSYMLYVNLARGHDYSIIATNESTKSCLTKKIRIN